MKLHAAEGTTHKARSIVVELVTITAGVLIALSVDSAAEWYHHRALVREARANLTSEIRDNRAELDKFLTEIPRIGEQLNRLLRFIGELQASRQRGHGELALGFNITQLSRASLDTADLTGAQGFMPYPEVKRYAELYGLQQQFNTTQQQLLDNWIPLLNYTHTDPARATDQELLEWKSRTLTVMSYLQVQSGIGQALRTRYDQALAGR